jgi:hypothetical protein
VADEKHSWWLGERIYIAVTAAKECFLGVSLAIDAGTDALTQAYGVFHAEALALNPDLGSTITPSSARLLEGEIGRVSEAFRDQV